MCDAYEWVLWQEMQEEAERRAMKEKVDELIKQSKATADKPAQPEKQQEEPVPA